MFSTCDTLFSVVDKVRKDQLQTPKQDAADEA